MKKARTTVGHEYRKLRSVGPLHSKCLSAYSSSNNSQTPGDSFRPRVVLITFIPIKITGIKVIDNLKFDQEVKQMKLLQCIYENAK